MKIPEGYFFENDKYCFFLANDRTPLNFVTKESLTRNLRHYPIRLTYLSLSVLAEEGKGRELWIPDRNLMQVEPPVFASLWYLKPNEHGIMERVGISGRDNLRTLSKVLEIQSSGTAINKKVNLIEYRMLEIGVLFRGNPDEFIKDIKREGNSLISPQSS